MRLSKCGCRCNPTCSCVLGCTLAYSAPLQSWRGRTGLFCNMCFRSMCRVVVWGCPNTVMHFCLNQNLARVRTRRGGGGLNNLGTRLRFSLIKSPYHTTYGAFFAQFCLSGGIYHTGPVLSAFG